MSTRPAHSTQASVVGAAQPGLSGPRVPDPTVRTRGWSKAALVLRVLLSAATLAPLAIAAAHTPQPGSYPARPGTAHHIGSAAGTAHGAGLLVAARRGDGSSHPSMRLAAFSEPPRAEAHPAHASPTANTRQPVVRTNRTVRASRCSGSVRLGDPGGSGMSVGGVGLNISLGADPGGRGWSRTERGCTQPGSDDSSNDHHHRWDGGRDNCGCPGRWNAPPARPGQSSLYNPTGYPGATGPTYPNTSYPSTGYPSGGYPGAGYPNTAYPGAGYPNTAYPGAAYPNTAYPNTAYPSAGYPGAGYPNTAYPGAGYPYPGYQGGTSWPGGANPCAGYPSGSAPVLDPTGRLVCVRPSNPTAGSGLGVGINLGGW